MGEPCNLRSYPPDAVWWDVPIPGFRRLAREPVCPGCHTTKFGGAVGGAYEWVHDPGCSRDRSQGHATYPKCPACRGPYALYKEGWCCMRGCPY